ncbi:hypothetical protein COV16_06370 [Candidatus Woesearchaeota archaeon CG10_big_fil_rev_8_21_14_0_10_34_8]|nr:MAG: hypothetical protein COV16_06370 [Candidatus Woesearchaeota archaeon CG10_big_fil_rev_8_21_14_0_10_34_8]
MLNEQRLVNMVKKKEAFLTLLEELDRTGKLRKKSYKERVNFTIDEEIVQKFKAYCKENNINMSKQIESLLKEYLKK